MMPQASSASVFFEQIAQEYQRLEVAQLSALDKKG
jgi:hypothetical protein